MINTLSKKLSILLYALMGLSVLFAILFYVGALPEGILITWAYILIVVTALITVVAPIVFFIQNPKNFLSF